MNRVLVTGMLPSSHPVTQSILELYQHIDRSSMNWDFLFYARDDDGGEVPSRQCRERIEELGGRVFTLDYSREKMTPAVARAFTALLQEHPEIRGVYHLARDLVNTGTVHHAHKLGLPLTALHAYSPARPPKPKTAAQRSLASTRGMLKREAHLCLASSADVGVGQYGDKLDFETLPFGVDLSSHTFKPAVRKKVRAQLGVSEEVPTVGLVGSFYRVKDVIFALRAFECFLIAYPNAHMVFLTANDEGAWTDYIAERGLAGKVTIVTDVEASSAVMCALDVLIVPVRTHVIPAVALEAQACGLPVVVPEHMEASVDATELVRRIPLFDYVRHPWQWACEAAGLLNMGFERHSYTDALADAGFDVRVNAQRLSTLFCERLEADTAHSGA